MYKETLNILNLLEENGFKSYIIGGYVRDKLLGIESDDIDIVTSAHPQDISNIFNIDLEDNYGSVKLNYKNYNYEITTFRKESDYLDNRRPSKIEYVSTLEEDVLRRDFTINAIAIDKNGNYIDLVNGIEDLNNKIIKCIKDADKSLKEDSLRILRALRFSSIYNFKLDNDLQESIINNKDLINNLSFDRIKRELDIIFSSSNVNLLFNMINYFGLYEILEIEPKNSVKITNNYLSIWAQLKFSDKYNFSNYEKKYINQIKDILKLGINNYTVYKYGVDIVKDADKILNSNINIDDLYKNLSIKSRKDIDITYDDIINLTSDKSLINQIYMDLEWHLLYNKLNNKKEDIISYLEGDKFE